MKNPIQTFEANTKGRDFVIGDLHGAHSVFLNLLDNLKFDGEVDRMFSVGDLIDRGPDSLLCLELLNEPWFHAVLANHEQMMYEAFTGGYMGMFFLQNGGVWALEALNDWKAKGIRVPTEASLKVFDALKIVEELPFVMTVNLMNGTKVHIIHAEIPPEKVSDEDLANSDRVRELATRQTRDGDFFVWGRHKFYQFYNTELSNHAKNIRIVKYLNLPINDELSPVISGHTIVQRPMTILGQTNIDTCAYGSYPDQYGSVKSWRGLTCLELNTWKFYKATATDFREVEPEVINSHDISKEDNHG